jgi:hypothetical protein
LFFSRDQSGTISANEIKLWLEKEGFVITEEQALFWVKGMGDIDGDGEVSFVKRTHFNLKSFCITVKLSFCHRYTVR